MEIEFRHIVFLKVASENAIDGVLVPLRSFVELGEKAGLYNDFLKKHGIGDFYAPRLVGNQTMYIIIGLLMETMLLEKAENDYRITQYGFELLENIGDKWQKWPYRLPVNFGKPEYNQSVPLPEL